MEHTLQTYADDYLVCTEFAAAYKRDNPDAVIKFGKVDGTEHAWVYDPEQDVTLDATMSQFFDIDADADLWPGDEHAHATQTAEFHTVEAFAQGPGGTALLEGSDV